MTDHKDLPARYLASCEKFFKSIKRQAASPKPQAPSCKLDIVGFSGKKIIESEK